ncbi:hypothetical protein KEM52_002225, partial [Ascosphaera acerosa]
MAKPASARDRLLRFTSPLLHLSAACFSAVAVGIVGLFLYDFRGLPLSRLIYVEIVAAGSLLFSAICVVPLQVRKLWPADIFFSLAWFAAFGLLMGYHQEFADADGNCPRSRVSTVNAVQIRRAPTCVQWDITELFAFLSGATLLASAFL